MQNCFTEKCPLLNNQSGKFCGLCGKRSAETEIPTEIDLVTPPDGILKFPIVKGEPDTLKGSKLISGNGDPTLGSRVGPDGWELTANLSRVNNGDHLTYEVVINDFNAYKGHTRKFLWNPEQEVRTQTVRITRNDPIISLSIIPAVAILSGKGTVSNIVVKNTGNFVADIDSPPIPYGYEIIDPHQRSGFRLAQGQSIELQIRQTDYTAQRRSFTLNTRDGKSIGKIELLPVEAPKLRMPPEYVVSIDFGTSNTSVFCMKTSTESISKIAISNLDERFPTLIYAPENVQESRWRALDVTGISNSEIVRNLKSLLRDPKANRDLNIRRLTFYLRQLLAQGIETYLDIVNPGYESSVEFVFTVPVLDGECKPNHEDYKNLLLNAAKAAGFEDHIKNWTINSILEPDAGSLEVLYDSTISQKFGNGDKLLVIDAGGGTTDVSLGTLHLRGNRPELIDVKNFSPKCEHGTGEIGGELFMWLLGEQWMIADKAGNIPESADQQQQNRNSKAKFINDNLVPTGEMLLDEVHFEDKFGTENSWSRVAPELRSQIESAKVRLSDESRKNEHSLHRTAEYELVVNTTYGDEIYTLPYTLLDTAVTDFTQHTVLQQIKDFLHESESPIGNISHVVLIGGTSNLFYYYRETKRTFGARTLPLIPTASIAVSRGATRIHQATPPTSPIGLSLKIQTQLHLFTSPGDMLNRTIRRRITVFNPGLPFQANMICTLSNGENFVFFGIQIPSGFNGTLIATVSPGTATMQLEDTNGTMAGEKLEVKI